MDAKVVLHNIGNHMVLLSKITAMNGELGVMRVNPLSRPPEPSFQSLMDLAGTNRDFRVLSVNRFAVASPQRGIHVTKR